MSIILL